ncbi:hypothetical protein DAT35_23330 [Vitiosangium sp. GDMCC 1.1324]|nr:hypothetical protein DAT35_23330 [Vitiosangium sp. GDMCC 1.1324]
MGELLSKRSKARVLLEASTESEWVARYLEELGYEVVVADPNFAPMYATRSRRVKTDKRDARSLAEACKLGAYRPAHRTSDAKRHMKAQLAVREALVRTRTRYISLVSSLVRYEGLRIADGEAESFVKRVADLVLPGSLMAQVAPLLSLHPSDPALSLNTAPIPPIRERGAACKPSKRKQSPGAGRHGGLGKNHAPAQ